MPKIVDKAQMRSEIIDAALRVFMQKGFGSTSMNDIAKETAIAKGTLYLYFDSKEHLIEEIIQRHFECLTQKYIFPASCDTLEEFLVCLEKTLILTNTEKSAVRVFFEIFGFDFQSKHFLRIYQVFSEGIMEHYATILRRLHRNDEISSAIDPETESKILFSMINGMMMHKSFFTVDNSTILQIIQRYIKRGLQQDD